MTQKIALVTGAMGGIGTAVCQELARAGHKVVASYHPQFDNKDEWLKEQEAAGFKDFVCVAGDVSDLASCQAMVAEAEAKAGPVDILVNNAGITRDTLMLRMSEQQWDDVIQTNLKSVFNMTKHALRHIMKAGGGSIINMSSVVGVFGQAGQANYAASKAGIIAFSKSIAKEYGSRSIRCNAIAPGFIETEMTAVLDEGTKEQYLKSIPLGRLGAGEDIANACVYLASDMGKYVSGQTLSICGGLNC